MECRISLGDNALDDRESMFGRLPTKENSVWIAPGHELNLNRRKQAGHHLSPLSPLLYCRHHDQPPQAPGVWSVPTFHPEGRPLDGEQNPPHPP